MAAEMAKNRFSRNAEMISILKKELEIHKKDWIEIENKLIEVNIPVIK